MKQYIFLFLVFLIPFLAKSESISIETLVNKMQSISAKNIDVTQYLYKKEQQTYIDISDPLLAMVTNEEVETDWLFIKRASGFEVKLLHDQFYLNSKPNLSNYPVTQCENNMVSSGEEYIHFENGNLYQHSWSCGTLGCSLSFVFTIGVSPCKY